MHHPEQPPLPRIVDINVRREEIFCGYLRVIRPADPRIGIVGAGLIGRAWAQVFARGGCEVRVWDPSPAQADAAIDWVGDSLRDLARHGLVDDPAGAARRVAKAPTLEAAAGAGDGRSSRLEQRPSWP